MSSDNMRVIVIGLDGATFDLILPWTKEGYLPAFKKLMEHGSWGELESTMPPLTGPAWSSFMTGKNPGKHGIFDFMCRDPKGYDWITINATQRKGPSFWRLLSDTGRRVIVFNVPVTYPPEEVNGVMISGYLTPPKAKDFVFPPTLKKDLEGQIGLDSTFFPGATYSAGREEKFIQAVDEMTDRTIRVMDFLMGRFPWDCFVGVFQTPDLLQHCLWKEIDHPVFGKAFLDQYQKIDQYLGTLLSSLDDRTLLMIISDHGFGDLKKQIFLNTWLLSKGFLKLKPTLTGKMKEAIFRLGIVPMKIHQLSLRLGMDLSNELMENRESLFSFLANIVLSFKDVDWERTRAYAMGNMGYICINLQGREPNGCVKPGEDYHATMREITEALYDLKDPETGEAIIDRVFFKKDIFSGPYLSDAPDLFPVPHEFRYHLRGDNVFHSNHWIEKFWLISGFHRAKGIFLAIGKNVKKGQKLDGQKIIDIAPTILTFMGVPMPSDLDGQHLSGLFEEEFSKTIVPFLYQPAEEPKPEERTLSSDEQAEIRKKLKSLGYIS
jgi:predicted AlkP superfamily phosphohydrolase/phosphomutase